MTAYEVLESFSAGPVRNFSVSVASGLLFSIAWWLVIDASAHYGVIDFPKSYHTAGAFGTLALILINLPPAHTLKDEIHDGCIGHSGIMCWLFFSTLMSFSSVISSAWILFGHYVAYSKPIVWPGVAIFLQNVLICAAAFLFRFGRTDD